MILGAVVVCREDYVIEVYHQFLLYIALLCLHGLLKYVLRLATVAIQRVADTNDPSARFRQSGSHA